MTGKAVVSHERLVRAKHLAMVGFVHVTGLPTQRSDTWTHYVCEMTKIEMVKTHRIKGVSTQVPKHPEPVIIQASRDHWGHHACNNGKIVLITEDGEVWLGTGGVDLKAVREYAPEPGAYVPCSNGDEVGMHLVLERVSDPYSDCNGAYSPFVSIETDEEISALADGSNALTERLFSPDPAGFCGETTKG